MRSVLLAGPLAVLALGFACASAAAADDGAAPCPLPVTKIYRIKPTFCPTTLVWMIPNAVGPDCCCGNGCGPYGIPPIYASGQNVLVRQTPEMQERVKEFLTELGALVEPKRTAM